MTYFHEQSAFCVVQIHENRKNLFCKHFVSLKYTIKNQIFYLISSPSVFQKLLQYKDDLRKTWGVMKEIIGKTRTFNINFSHKIKVGETDISEKVKIANAFNHFFTNAGPELASKITSSSKNFKSFVKKIDSDLPIKALSINELKEVFYSLKINKSPGYVDINFNVIKQCFRELSDPLKFLFDLLLHKGTFPDNLKIAKVTPIYNTGETECLGNYRPISVLPCFSKILERIMYNIYINIPMRKIFCTKSSLVSKRSFNRACYSTTY